MKNVLIIIGRGYSNFELVKFEINALNIPETTICSPHEIVIDYAKSLSINTLLLEPDELIVNDFDIKKMNYVIVFHKWLPNSKNCKRIINVAKQNGIQTKWVK